MQRRMSPITLRLIALGVFALILLSTLGCGGGSEEPTYDCSWKDDVITIDPGPSWQQPPGKPIYDSPRSPCDDEQPGGPHA